MTTKTKIALADDELLIRTGIRAILAQEDNFDIIFEASNGTELIDFLNSSNMMPEIILMDVKMPELNGLEASKIILKNFPNIKIIALSSYNSSVFVANMIEVGAVCYLSKSAHPAKLISSINQVIQNGFYFEEDMMQFIDKGLTKTKTLFDKGFLTLRERQVLHLICEQKTAVEIAEKLKISARTVDGFRNSLLFKTDSKNIVGLVIFALQHHIYSLDENDFLKL
jgi:DNA-binding NarL/FixJ family response regulator